jgi:hypothetical protein
LLLHHCFIVTGDGAVLAALLGAASQVGSLAGEGSSVVVAEVAVVVAVEVVVVVLSTYIVSWWLSLLWIHYIFNVCMLVNNLFHLLLFSEAVGEILVMNISL